MYAHLAETPVLSLTTINAVRKAHTNLAIGDVDTAGFRTIANPFNLGAAPTSGFDPVLSDRIQPERLRIPEFVEGEQILQFMGFEIHTAVIIWHKYRNGPPRPEAEDLLWCAIQYLTYVEAQATRDGIDDQHMIKLRMGFDYGETLFRIDNEIPVTPVTKLGPRVLFWIIPIISRRYDFVYDLEDNLRGSRLSGWPARTKARTMNYGSQALREGVESWFHHMAYMVTAFGPRINSPSNMPIREEGATMAFPFVNGLDDMSILEKGMDAAEPVDACPRTWRFVKRRSSRNRTLSDISLMSETAR